MRNLTLLILLFTSISYSQITQVKTSKSELIGKIGVIGETWLECNKNGNTYTFTYKDMKFQHLTEYKSFSFEDVDNAFDNLYNTILSGLESKPEDDITLELPNDIVWLKFKKTMGVISVEFWHSVNKNADIIGVSTWMNKKKLAKLFGKKRKK